MNGMYDMYVYIVCIKLMMLPKKKKIETMQLLLISTIDFSIAWCNSTKSQSYKND